jgi:hypothetical protein
VLTLKTLQERAQEQWRRYVGRAFARQVQLGNSWLSPQVRNAVGPRQVVALSEQQQEIGTGQAAQPLQLSLL